MARAFYDLDGTLVDINLVHATFFFAVNLGAWHSRVAYAVRLLLRLPALFFAERADRHLLNVELYSLYRGISRDRLAALGEEYCDRMLVARLYPQAREILEGNRRAGLEPVLVSGSPDFVVEAFARRLGIADFAANRLVFRGQRATGRVHEPVMAASAKASWCAEYAARRKIDLGNCWAYADSYYDLPFLSVVGHPVAVNPDRRLEAVARSRQWPVLRFVRAPAPSSSLWPDRGAADPAGRASASGREN